MYTGLYRPTKDRKFFLPPDKLIYIYKVIVTSLIPFTVLNGVFCFGTRWKIVLRWKNASLFRVHSSWCISFRDSSWHSQLLLYANGTLTKTIWIIRLKAWNGLGSFRLSVRNWDQKSRYVSGLSYMGIFSWCTCLPSLREFVKSKWNAHLHVKLSVELTYLNFAWANAHVFGLKSNIHSSLNSKSPLCFSCLFLHKLTWI